MGSLRSDQRVIGESILPFEDIPFHLAAREITPTYKIYIQSVLRACHSRRFFITDTGYMGIAPDNAKIMDHVYICAGATVPFVFRRIDGKLPEQEEGQFRLIGECHLEKMAWDVFENAPNALEYLEIV
ncbi:uncharacterized protein TRIVIDRAFT_223393 [Trichoderma virens Gv29-8]|uniref:Heterokaryon incompatibility domain-containing protein n=1 Tax=Hypocrea virens (strain Gv29-8 / FGSC 10586) TaxID=413071 RepID=G9MWZ2_HYPVG|nr:uncharacterized protein TRIVIDRAFT_223393 [Trichoderma virens Gv29-8]EHK21124.1 hypothetical protein TRIVIDRAFT_223393 [Trichoderma virens Gv29-8]